MLGGAPPACHQRLAWGADSCNTFGLGLAACSQYDHGCTNLAAKLPLLQVALEDGLLQLHMAPQNVVTGVGVIIPEELGEGCQAGCTAELHVALETEDGQPLAADVAAAGLSLKVNPPGERRPVGMHTEIGSGCAGEPAWPPDLLPWQPAPLANQQAGLLKLESMGLVLCHAFKLPYGASTATSTDVTLAPCPHPSAQHAFKPAPLASCRHLQSHCGGPSSGR
jgi:hypothetical protein